MIVSVCARRPSAPFIAPFLLAALVALPSLIPATAAAQSAEELPEYLQALGYLDWDEGADPHKWGVVRFDRQRTAPGYNLYTDDADQIFLSDLSGERVHSWRVPADAFKKPPEQCEHALLLRSGLLAVVCAFQGIVFLDWDSRRTYVAPGPFHHDVVEMPDGRLLTVARTQQLQYAGREVGFDGLIVFSLEGGGSQAWSSYTNLAALQKHHPPHRLDTPPPPWPPSKKLQDYYHLNSIQLLPDSELGRKDTRFQRGNWLLSLRNVSLVVILDSESQQVVWSYGPGTLELQHTPTMLSNGNILIFDNGAHRGYTRVLELEPASGTIAWEYRGTPPESFFSRWQGHAQRLDNGNTLITESDRGHVFEITREGEIVWEFWNTEIEDDKRKRIYRMVRLPASRVADHLKRPPQGAATQPAR